MTITYRLPPPDEYTPPCAGNSEFFSVRTRGKALELARMCREKCQCLTQCAQDAEDIRATAIGHVLPGVWGGRVYTLDNAASA